jgi:hypothetical protein
MKCQRMEFRQTGCIPPPQHHFQPQPSFFSRHNPRPVLLCKVRYIEHLLNIIGEDKRFIFVTKDSEINTNITIFVLAHDSLPIGDTSTSKQSYLQSYIIKLSYLLYLTIICVCLRVIIIMTVVDDGPYTHTTILIDALFILGHGVELVSTDIYCFISCNSE